MNRIFDRKIILEDGTEFYGYGFGAKRDALVELVFNTSMVGYQEILSDPSYTAQAVVMTYPLIGNYGMCNEDYETDRPTISGLVVREFNSEPSNFRAARTLEDVMIQYDIVGIAGVDTRRLARHIRDEGTCKALIVDAQTPSIACLVKMRSTALPTNQVSVVSTKSPWISACANPKHRVVAVDCGIKHNIIRSLNARGCEVTIVPWTVTVEEVMAMHPDGLFISNGPGNPEDAKPVIDLVRALRGKMPIFGICLWTSDHRPCLRCVHLQAEIRPPGRKSPCQKSPDGEGGDHLPEPFLRGKGGFSGGNRPDRDPCQPAGRYGGGAEVRRRPDIQRPVPSGKRPRPPGQRLPVR